MTSKIINGKLYDTDKAHLILDDTFADGSNELNNGRATYLYRTRKGNYFVHYSTCWQNERDTIFPLTIEEAKQTFYALHGDADCWPEDFGQPEEA